MSRNRKSNSLWCGLVLWLLLMGVAFSESMEPCVVCSVEQAKVHIEDCSFSTTWEGNTYHFCEKNCKARFLKTPEKWSRKFASLTDQPAKSPESLPNFRFPLEPAGSISSADISGKVVLLNLWANWCQPCLEEMPDLVKLQDEFKEDGLVVIALSFDKSKDLHSQGVRKLGLNFISVFADQAAVQTFLKELGPIKSIPVSFVVNDKGKIVHRLEGAANLKRFRELVKPLLKSPDKSSSRQSGGAIVPS